MISGNSTSRNTLRRFLAETASWLKKIAFPLAAFSVLTPAAAIAEPLSDSSRRIDDSSDFLEMIAEYKDTIEYGKDGRISRVTSYDGSYDVFEYGSISGKVERIISHDSSGRQLEITVFYRDSVTGQLLGYNKTSSLGFFSLLDKDNDVFLKGTSDKYNVYNTFFSSLVITTDSKALDFSYDDQGRLVVKRDDGKTTVYNQMGKVVSDGDAQYAYDEDGELRFCEVVTDGNLVSRTEYRDSVEHVSEFFKNGLIEKRIIYDASGNIEERFEGGKLYAKIKYRDDNKNVSNIEYFR